MINGRPRPPRMRLFHNDSLERLTVVSPKAFAATWIAVLALALYESWGSASVLGLSGLVALGLMLWTLFEYWMHRFIFHLKLRTALGRRVIFLMHGNHHEAPADAYRNLMPPIVSMAILGTVWCVFLLLLGPAGSPLFLGFAIGYVLYDVVHYACHQFPMRHPILRQLRRHHTRHHYGRLDGNYAITAIIWDRVFRTNIPVKKR
jgi:sterol desaturase/sphingolipid hydroxylase (fatty acid hydroxylase superfamily)